MKFYTFRENNSGGRFLLDKEGVIVLAESAEEANDIAECNPDSPIYFDGVADERDCACCGDRWYPVEEYNGEIFAHDGYGSPLNKEDIKDYLCLNRFAL